MVTIRPWVEGDIEYVVQSTSREKWGNTRSDVERCLYWEPDGCFVAEEGPERVGHISTITYGKLGWIGLLVVNRERRGRGIGTALMQKGVDHLRQSRVETIKLEAEERAVPLYRRFGFTEEFVSLRYGGQAEVAGREPLAPEISLIQPGDLRSLVAFDSDYFGSSRDRVLKVLFEGNPRGCFIARRNGLVGYIMRRRTHNGYWMGPWICTEPVMSEELLNASLISMDDAGTELRFGFPSPNDYMSRLMRKRNFEFREGITRMFLGEDARGGKPQCVYGLGGPEKG
jgi:ribosomal protein S18 acetylase RimI-like enzyme